MSEISGTSSTQSEIKRSVLVVAAGFFTVGFLSFATDTLVQYVAGYPGPAGVYSNSQLRWASIYHALYLIMGSYTTACLAPSSPMKHSLAGGAIIFILALSNAAVAWNHGPSLGPRWYSISLLIAALPTAWFGAKIRLWQIGPS
jgi:hypothetical protein